MVQALQLFDVPEWGVLSITLVETCGSQFLIPET